jgi:hypothetical protein
LSSDLSSWKWCTNLFLRQHKIRCKQIIDEFFIWRRLHAEVKNNRRSYNQHSQRLQFVICFLHIQNCFNHIKDCEKQIDERKKAHFVKRLQSSSFDVKRNIQIDSTRCNKSIHRRRFANVNATHIIDEHNYLKSTTFEQYNRFRVYDQLIREQRDQLRNAFWFQLIVESHIDFHHIHIWNKFCVDQTKKAWKRVDVEKLRNNLRLLVVSSSLNIVEQVKIFANLIQSSIYKAIDAVVSWTKFVLKSKSHWN